MKICRVKALKFRNYFSPEILDPPAQPLFYLLFHLIQRKIIKTIYFYNPGN